MPDLQAPLSPTQLTTLGWYERLALPELGIEQVFAKIDSGAELSTLHATQIHLMVVAGKDWVEFTAPLQRNQREPEAFLPGGVRRVRAPLLEERSIISSNGEEELRPVVSTTVVLAGLQFEAEFSLTNREGLQFPALLGRSALAGRFCIDPGRVDLLAPFEST